MCDNVLIKVFEYMLSTFIIFAVFFSSLYVLHEFVKQCKHEVISIIAIIGTCFILIVSFIITASNL